MSSGNASQPGWGIGALGALGGWTATTSTWDADTVATDGAYQRLRELQAPQPVYDKRTFYEKLKQEINDWLKIEEVL